MLKMNEDLRLDAKHCAIAGLGREQLGSPLAFKALGSMDRSVGQQDQTGNAEPHIPARCMIC